MDQKKPALVGLLLHDQDGYMIQMILRDCMRANLARQPELWCCAMATKFLGEHVRTLGDIDPRLRLWTSYKMLVRLWRTAQHREATDALIALMLRSSPGANEVRIREGRNYNRDGTLARWDLRHSALRRLPEEFGTVRVTHTLNLNNNQLRSLPESFGDIIVGNGLSLSHNHIGSLPESFCNITVGRTLSLTYNQLTSLPESVGDINVSEDLDLMGNQLTSLPESFGNITVGRDLDLSGNRLTSLPESFSDITLGGDLFLKRNPINSVPVEVIRYRITAELRSLLWPPRVGSP